MNITVYIIKYEKKQFSLATTHIQITITFLLAATFTICCFVYPTKNIKKTKINEVVLLVMLRN